MAEPLTAIGVLLEPNGTMIAKAKAANLRLRAEFPEGFALDADHAPHITVVQCFVSSDELESVYDAVASTLDESELELLELEANGLYRLPWENLALAGITVAATPQLLALQKSILDALASFMRIGGDHTAFVGRPTSPTIGPTADYVQAFATSSTGSAYNPHVTIGVAPVSFVDAMIAEPFDAFIFGVDRAAIYQLGDLGTAQRELWSSGAGSPA